MTAIRLCQRLLWPMRSRNSSHVTILWWQSSCLKWGRKVLHGGFWEQGRGRRIVEGEAVEERITNVSIDINNWVSSI